jgi:hypothetical protein
MDELAAESFRVITYNPAWFSLVTMHLGVA